MSFQSLLFCPDEKTARVVTQILTELDFTVEVATEPFAAVKKLMAQHFDAVVVDCSNEQNATLMFKSVRQSASSQSSLAVAVVEGQAGVAQAFRIGANLVLTRPINVEQAKGTLRVARGLLRKSAEPAKPAAPSLPPRAASSSGSDTVPVAPAAKFAGGSFPAQKANPPAVPVASAGGFEVESDPAPEPEPAEAALLEYMHDSVPTTTRQASAPAPPVSLKEYPWQPVSKPAAGPMGSSPQPPAETADKKAAGAASAAAKESRPFVASMARSQGAASAPAPAKEAPPAAAESKSAGAAQPAAAPESKPRPANRRVFAAAPAPTPAPVVEPPKFSALDSYESQTGPDAGGSKTGLMIAAVAVVLVAGGYFGWTRMRASQQPAPQVQIQAPAVVPPPANPAPAAASTSQPQETAAPPAALAQTGPASESSTATRAAAEQTPTVRPLLVSKSQPIIVQRGAGVPPSASAAQESAALPSPAEVGSSGAENTLSSIVSSASVSVPRVAAPRTLKISQGVSQGLVLRKVQPVYPRQSMQMRVQGVVQLQATVSKEGSISQLQVLSGDAVLARAAMDAVKQWKYRPYLLNGEPVEIQTQITVNFKLP